jgi:hypothetical protein
MFPLLFMVSIELTGWQQTSWGMTAEDVLKHYPNAVRKEFNDGLNPGPRITYDGYEVSGRKFRVIFEIQSQAWAEPRSRGSPS